MKKKSIAIIASLAGIGGTERALVNLLHFLPPQKYEVEILTLSRISEQIRISIPEYVKVTEIRETRFRMFCIILLLTFQWGKLFRILRLLHSKNKLCDIYIEKKDQLERPKREYDVAISYSLPISRESVYTITSVTAKHKYCWIHLDARDEDSRIIGFEKVYKEYDRIVNVSEACRQSFEYVFPKLKEKCCVIQNLLPIEQIHQKSILPCECLRREGKTIIISVSRLSQEKQPLFAVGVTEKLLQMGCTNFIWYFIGDGVLHEEMQKRITEKKLQDNLVLLGTKGNPYPYIKQADLFVQLSRVETFCLAVAEAMVLGVPIISTDFPAAHELVDDNSGVITENSEEGIVCALGRVMLCGISKKNDNYRKIDLINKISARKLEVLFEKCYVSK